MIRHLRASQHCRGIAYVAAMILLAAFSALGVAMAAFCNLSLRKSANYCAVVDARLEAESGAAFMLERLGTVRLPGTTTETTFAAYLLEVLGEKLNGTSNLAGQSVTVVDGAVCVPQITLGAGSFSSRFNWASESRCRMVVQGTVRGVSRRIAMDLALVPQQPLVFDYGLASRGKISISGNAKIMGVNYPGEASVLSATREHTEAIHVDGNVVISGDLGVSEANHTVVITGTPSIAGSTDPEVYSQHIHFGVDTPDFPGIDVSPLTALATNVVDATTDTSSPGLTFSNIRIAAGTNPTFASDVVINGAVYVEAPNIVYFECKTTLNGFVVTQDSAQPIESCQIFFGGHVEAFGVDALPDTEEFAAVKQQTGTFVLAPGFAVTFAGRFSAVNGTIAADQLTFSGTAEGIIRGAVIGLKDRVTKLDGNVEILVDRQNADPDPAGFVKSFALEPDPASYAELVGG